MKNGPSRHEGSILNKCSYVKNLVVTAPGGPIPGARENESDWGVTSLLALSMPITNLFPRKGATQKALSAEQQPKIKWKTIGSIGR
jgi:hypothetical protein